MKGIARLVLQEGDDEVWLVSWVDSSRKVLIVV